MEVEEQNIKKKGFQEVERKIEAIEDTSNEEVKKAMSILEVIRLSFCLVI